MLSFDVTDKQIRIIRGTEAGGKIKVSNTATVNVPDGMIANGHIRDIPQMANLVNEALKNNHMMDKEAVISLSSNLMVFKELEIPKVKPTQIKQMVISQMQQSMGVTNEFAISYTIAGSVKEDGKDLLKILATACPRDMVDGYKRVFNMLNITLKMVAASNNCISRIVMNDPKLKDKCPMLLVQINENFLSLDLYENGHLSFTRFVTIDPNDYDDKNDYVFEAVNDQVFRMFQFQKTRSQNHIHNVTFYGDTSQYIRLTNAMEQMDISTQILKVPSHVGGYENFEFANFANAIGAMYKRQKETESINLIENDFASVAKTEVSGASVGLQAILAIVFCGLIIGGAWLFFDIITKNYKETAAISESWIKSDTVAKQLADLEIIQGQVEKAQKYNDTIVDLSENYNTLPVIKTQILDAIYDSLKVGPKVGNDNEVQGMVATFGYSAGTINLGLNSKYMQNPADIAARLDRLENFFLSVAYNGYSGSTDAEYTDPADDKVYKLDQPEEQNNIQIGIIMAGEKDKEFSSEEEE